MAQSANIASAELAAAHNFDRLLGFALVAGLPAVFWSTLLHVAANAMGYAPSFAATATFAAATALFLSLVFAALTSPARP